MAYQGYMTDSNGDPLGATAPANYDTVFASGRFWRVMQIDLLWSEQQTVTFDKGYFSVLLGEGATTRVSLEILWQLCFKTRRRLTVTSRLR